MKAIVVSPDGPQLATVAVPTVGPHDVLVRVHAAALNRADLHVAAGHRHGASGGAGAVIGIEWAGEIAALGGAVPAESGLTVGDRVMCSGAGGYADRCRFLADAGWRRLLAPGRAIPASRDRRPSPGGVGARCIRADPDQWRSLRGRRPCSVPRPSPSPGSATSVPRRALVSHRDRMTLAAFALPLLVALASTSPLAPPAREAPWALPP